MSHRSQIQRTQQAEQVGDGWVSCLPDASWERVKATVDSCRRWFLISNFLSDCCVLFYSPCKINYKLAGKLKTERSAIRNLYVLSQKEQLLAKTSFHPELIWSEQTETFSGGGGHTHQQLLRAASHLQKWAVIDSKLMAEWLHITTIWVFGT